MALKKWQKLANERGIVEKQSQDILQAYKNKKPTKRVKSNYKFRTFKTCNQEIREGCYATYKNRIGIVE